MADIFISYAREDQGRIEPLAHAFADNGWSVFWDRHIPYGKDWRGYIGKALDEARCVVVAWSQHSVASGWVSDEAEFAKSRGNLIPVRLDAVEPPLGFRGLQTADLTGWHAGEASPAFEEVVRDVSAVIAGRSERGAAGGGAQPVRVRPPRRGSRVRVAASALLVVLVLGAGLWTWRHRPAPTPPILPAPPVASPPAVVDEEPFFMARRVTEEDLAGKTRWELDVMRNEIYARHGRRFDRQDLQRYFDTQPWYRPRYAPDAFPNDLLSDVQRQNVQFIRSFQQRGGGG